ncbi:UvrD-helicase domain-containing protein [Chitinophaga sp. S165]|uniref:UvrD-helicase domain-containing protein n=1 Tax=Chitinophaga sp. S165 TaxID=2135462 RepID=UPI000D98153C|nr:UvrD-helicase domain-containing protein [Chitinophaga sp. S165]PWV55540.1 superfamily I DNA/RNA helicase [Chitinophaga sp. S165]
MLQITNDDIAYAEQILFSRTGVFDQERIRFICELDTCDLQAVPGSGKTTVLLAKLLILERYLPLADSRAILVISHTNAAVDEIRDKISAYCPKLFSSPHFIGTIQGFVDKFLAIPYYTVKFKRRPKRIDDEIYYEKVSRFSTTVLGGRPIIDQNNARYYLNFYQNVGDLRFALVGNAVRLTTGINGPDISIKRPRSTAATDWNPVQKQGVLAWLHTFKLKILKDGYLCFDDAYYLADRYLAEFPRITSILQKRFQFVFVDEMQDMAKHQYELLERVFANSPANTTIYQRIGDKNQAIYSNISQGQHTWADRPLVLQLNGSHRLSPHVARIVEKIAHTPIQITGHQTNADGTPIDLLPHILIYNDRNIGAVISHFAQLIAQYRASGDLPRTGSQKYKAICWNAQADPQRIRLTTYHPSFDRRRHTPKVNYSSLESYLHHSSNNAFAGVVKNIYNALLRVLRLEAVEPTPGLSYNKTELNKFLKEQHPQVYDTLQRNLYRWSRQILMGQSPTTLIEIRAFLPMLLALFQKNIHHANNFVNGPPVVVAANVAAVAHPMQHPNVFVHPDFNIEVMTVHACKGQTHTATLYMESHYQKDIGGAGSHESERLADFLLGAARPNQLHKFVEQSLKMAYVGFSRPTHLLCFAVHERHYLARLTGLLQRDWTFSHIP